MENALAWAQKCYGDVDLGDVRLTRRAQSLATELCERPGASVCAASRGWSGAKGNYRFLSNKSVTRGALLEPHLRDVRAQCRQSGAYLMIEDTTSLDFTDHQALADVGWTGDGRGRGMLVHSTVACRVEGWDDGDRPRVNLLGLFHQEVWSRHDPPKRARRQTMADRFNRERESQRWGRIFSDENIVPPDECQWTLVADREGDIFEVLEERTAAMDYIIRSKHPRKIANSDDNIRLAVAQAPELCLTQLYVRARPGHKSRVAKLKVRACQLSLRAPWRPDGLKRPAHPTWVVEVKESDPPKGVEPLYWVLLTSWDCSTAQATLQVIGAYTRRWLIEEYHKALKSGTAIESAQLRTTHAVENLMGFLAVLAVRLLQAKLEPDALVDEQALVPGLIDVLNVLTKSPPSTWTNRTLLRAIAQRGGFLGRKGDGEPGWKTIWRGVLELNAIALGYQIGAKRCG